MTTDPSRRAVELWEQPHLQALGGCLRALRHQAGLSQEDLAIGAGMAERSIRRLERGERRTRRSTLERLAHVLASAQHDRHPQHILALLVAVAGPALAPESPYADRIERRRRRRARRQARDPVTRHTVRYLQGADHLVAFHRHERRHSRRTLRVREYSVVLPVKRLLTFHAVNRSENTG